MARIFCPNQFKKSLHRAATDGRVRIAHSSSDDFLCIARHVLPQAGTQLRFLLLLLPVVERVTLRTPLPTSVFSPWQADGCHRRRYQTGAERVNSRIPVPDHFRTKVNLVDEFRYIWRS